MALQTCREQRMGLCLLVLIGIVCCSQTSIECVLTIEEISSTVCRQTLEGDVTISIPGLGSIAERIIRESLKDVYSNIPKVVERCVSG